MILLISICLILLLSALSFLATSTHFLHSNTHLLSPRVSFATSRCQQLQLKARPPRDFHRRNHSDRYTPGTRPTLLKHARIWTGEKNGTDIVRGDVLLDRGLIKAVGHVPRSPLKAFENDLVVVDVQNAWVTPGIVDMHSHIGNSAAPELAGASNDYNSNSGNIQPWLRSLDGLNTYDRSYELSISGGITTALVLPGSGNAIGGQGFVIKLRNTEERSPTSMLLEPPQQTNRSLPDANNLPRWRHMKHACGENPSHSYSSTRMDTIWALREAYNNAKALQQAQDAYCAKMATGKWSHTVGDFPEDIQWEALVDVLRGRTKVHIHCYEAVDLDNLIHLSNEFQFPIAAFYHASEAYLVPSVLKKTYGGAPSLALSATNARYKREAYRSSEFAPRILADHGLNVVMKSDHPVLNSRYLLYEAQQAHFYGLPAHLAIASVTSTPSRILGLDHRIGFVKAGWDADLVIWDSHPLVLGATPIQVFIDGSVQLQSPYVVNKPQSFQKFPKVPNHDKEAAEAIEYDGLPPLSPKAADSDVILFINVRNLFTREGNSVRNIFLHKDEPYGVVAVRNGSISYSGTPASCPMEDLLDARIVNLRGGSISPGLISFGSSLGLEHIAEEFSTNDGIIRDPLIKAVPRVSGPDVLIHAVDGLQLASRDAL